MRGQEGFRHGRRLQIVEALGDADDMPLVHDDAVGEAATADEAEDAVA